MSKFDIVVIGRSCLDVIAVVNQFPRENQKRPLESRLTEGGGQGGTASCCITRLGGRVAYVGKLGDDTEGRFCLKRLTDFGVTTEFVEIVKGGRTPVAYVFITAESGARSIIYERNALPKIKLDHELVDLVRQTGVVLLDPEVTYLGGPIKMIAGSDAKVIYDGERWRPGIEQIMQTADYFIPSAEFLTAAELKFDDLTFTQQIIELNSKISGTLIVTRGEYGAYYVSRHRLFQVAVPPVTALDTVGAGDNFHAAFALASCCGFDIHRSVKFAVAVASLSCREYGGRAGIPSWDQALDFADGLTHKIVTSIDG